MLLHGACTLLPLPFQIEAVLCAASLFISMYSSGHVLYVLSTVFQAGSDTAVQWYMLSQAAPLLSFFSFPASAVQKRSLAECRT